MGRGLRHRRQALKEQRGGICHSDRHDRRHRRCASVWRVTPQYIARGTRRQVFRRRQQDHRLQQGIVCARRASDQGSVREMQIDAHGESAIRLQRGSRWTALGHYRYRTIQAQGAGDDLAWAPPPGFTPDERETVYGFQLTINSFSKQKEAAWQFVKFMTTPAAQAIAAQGGEVVARASAYNDPYFASPQGRDQRA